MNAVEIEEAVSDLIARYADQGFDPDHFPFDFLEAFGNPAATVKRLRTAGKSSTNQSDVGGVLQARNIHLKVCEPGRVNDTLRELLDSPETAKRKCKFALATDGVTVEAVNVNPASGGGASGGGETLACDFADLPDRFAFFLELAGIRTVRAIRENAFDVKATGRLNKLYLELLRHNPDWGTDARRRDMNHFMARLIFCFFAEDTGIFTGNAHHAKGDGLFTTTVQQMTEPDGSNTAPVLADIFHALNTNSLDRDDADLRPWAKKFPYVNGGLFRRTGIPACPETPHPSRTGIPACPEPQGAKHMTGRNACPTVPRGTGIPACPMDEVPAFTKIARSYLLHIGSLDWKKINPDIFGSMIQAVADDAERGALGMHYTSVPNILKVLNPLFLDDLRQKLDDAGDPRALDNGAAAGAKRKLLNLRNRLARIRVFDPACGSGNFLVIAYKEMRKIEATINARRGEKDRPSDIPLTNFRGIELRHFAAEVARLALIIAEYQCDALHRGEKLALAEFLPLGSDNWITCGNALRLDWQSVCPPAGTAVKLQGDDLFNTPRDQSEIDFDHAEGETYICGNPPYIGTKYQSKEVKRELADVFDGLPIKLGNADYVFAWMKKASDMLSKSDTLAFAFVSTNSVFEGEQAAFILWLLSHYKLDIEYAHRSFRWANNAAKNAGVTVCITKFRAHGACGERHIVEGENVLLATNIGPYLIDMPSVVVAKRSRPISKVKEMSYGSMANDAGHLMLSRRDHEEAIEANPHNSEILRKAVGGADFINGETRYAIYVPDDCRLNKDQLAYFQNRFELVRQVRSGSKRPATNRLAETPYLFGERRHADGTSVFMPQTLSERRDYLTAGLLDDSSMVIAPHMQIRSGGELEFALIVSRLHLVWVATVCGKLKTDYRYSNTLGWNTFPVPALTDGNRAELTECAQGILLAREAYWPATIAEMYDPRKMDAEYPDLRRAHDRNDETLERIYLGRRFKNDTERLEHLFQRYTDLTAA